MVRAGDLELVVPHHRRRDGHRVHREALALQRGNQVRRDTPATEGILEVGVDAQIVLFPDERVGALPVAQQPAHVFLEVDDLGVVPQRDLVLAESASQVGADRQLVQVLGVPGFQREQLVRCDVRRVDLQDDEAEVDDAQHQRAHEPEDHQADLAREMGNLRRRPAGEHERDQYCEDHDPLSEIASLERFQQVGRGAVLDLAPRAIDRLVDQDEHRHEEHREQQQNQHDGEGHLADVARAPARAPSQQAVDDRKADDQQHERGDRAEDDETERDLRALAHLVEHLGGQDQQQDQQQEDQQVADHTAQYERRDAQLVQQTARREVARAVTQVADAQRLGLADLIAQREALLIGTGCLSR